MKDNEVEPWQIGPEARTSARRASLPDMVSDGSLTYAKIDRPKGIINFAKRKPAEEVRKWCVFCIIHMSPRCDPA